MAQDTNVVVIVGRLTRDPDVKFTAGGTAVANLRVATTTRGKVNGEWADKPNYLDVVVFGRQAENVDKYLTKGSRVGVTGRLEWREWEGKDGVKRQAVEVVCDHLQFLTDRSDTAAAGGGGDVPAPRQAAPVVDTDIPF